MDIRQSRQFMADDHAGDTTMYSTSTSIIPGMWIQGAGITTPVQVIGYGTGVGLDGTYILSNPAWPDHRFRRR